jgi:hypothetical protein
VKKAFVNPKAEDLKEGQILPIYTDYMNQKDFEAHAILLKYEPSNWRTEVPYVRAELGSDLVRDFMTINWSFCRWKVQFVDGPKKGFITHRYIAYFLCISNKLESGYKINEAEDEEEDED